MRRGRIITGGALLLSVFSLAGATAAYADGGTPQDICNDLKDGVVNGSYTAAQWTAFFNDPTVQGYGCGGTIVPPQTPPATTPPTTTPPATTPPSTTPPTATPPATTPPTSTPAVPLTPIIPVVISGVAGARQTVSAPAAKSTPVGVKGASHTVKTPTSRTAAAPLGTTKTRGTLPFTGAQLTLFALVGLALLATGLVLRATGRRRPQE